MILLAAIIIVITNAIYYGIIWENLSKTAKKYIILFMLIFSIASFGFMFDKPFPRTFEARELFIVTFAGFETFSLIIYIWINKKTFSKFIKNNGHQQR
jgi:hypothetical protein